MCDMSEDTRTPVSTALKTVLASLAEGLLCLRLVWMASVVRGIRALVGGCEVFALAGVASPGLTGETTLRGQLTIFFAKGVGVAG